MKHLNYHYLKIGYLFFLIFLLNFFAGCIEKKQEPKKDYLIRAGKTFISAGEFKRAFEFSKSSYAYDLVNEKEFLQKARIQFLDQVCERLILMERARELGIWISDSDLKSAIELITKDYPEGEFENQLLESTISFTDWRKELKTRLLMEKVIEKDLTANIPVSPDEIAAYKKEHYKKSKIRKMKKEELDKAVTALLKREKSETAYKSWIDKLRKRYNIQINESDWKKIKSEN